MLHKTRGIVFKNTRYSESGIIVKIYTEKFGLQTYIVSGIRKANARLKAGMYQHGNMLDLVVYYRETGNIFRISEAKYAEIYTDIHFNIIKGTILLFYVEVLNKVIKEEESNSGLFDFIYTTFDHLDKTRDHIANHHLYFLLELSKHLGFYPSVNNGKYFNLNEGSFQEEIPRYGFFADERSSSKIKSLISSDDVPMDHTERKVILHHLLNYFRLHMEGFGELRSPAILEELFRS